MESAIYQGVIRHRRHTPVEHGFAYRLFLLYLDLDELDEVFAGRWLWSTRRRAVARFDRRDHFGDPRQPLDLAVRDLVEERTGRRPSGPIRMLTHLRYFGHCFNPVSFYYCFGPGEEHPHTVVAEVDNTPWGERHCYVMSEAAETTEASRVYEFPKEFHVSPFIGMDVDYRWRVTRPGERLLVHAENLRGGRPFFDATLNLERREISTSTLAAALARYPFVTAKVVAAIYYQAFRLWLKRVPFHPHPRARGGAGDGSRNP